MMDNPAIAALIAYKCSAYNIVDLAVFGLPFAGSINQFKIMSGTIQGSTANEGNAGIFSFAAIFIFLHIGGRYDAVNEDFGAENWQFHALMMIYFFFTVILMLNVLIALINGAFNDGDETWRQVWLLNRLQVVESAENLSYLIPGYRQSSPWFPTEIYYSATEEEIREFAEKYPSVDNQDVVKVDKSRTSDPEDPWTSLQTQQEAARRKMEDMCEQAKRSQEQLQGQGIKLQDQIVTLKNQNNELKDQLRHQQESLEAQINGLKAFMKELLPSKPS
ncbi:hypothetical protein BGZ70_003520 [Mortierella alpina]|uniref:Ion transport domain-containing protein n=1 Tax=Mortierella alpina TaxID=64518 RepID=A0A9P6ISM9_MORAP|nr:hypothetical protein BGZ70_003520 [Mortierella alpina]